MVFLGCGSCECKAEKARARQEKKSKYAARRAMKKKYKESDYKAAVKALKGSIQGCKGAQKWINVAKQLLGKRKSQHLTNEKSVKKCNKTLAKHKAELTKLSKKLRIQSPSKKSGKKKKAGKKQGKKKKAGKKQGKKKKAGKKQVKKKKEAAKKQGRKKTGKKQGKKK